MINIVFFWSILASLHPCNNGHPKKASKYKQCFNELNIQGFDFPNGFKCSDIHRFEKITNLSINIFELNFYQEQNKRKHILLPIQIIKNETDRVTDLLVYKNHYVFIEYLNVFLGKQSCRYICKRCLNSYTNENLIIKHKQQNIHKKLTCTRTSLE